MLGDLGAEVIKIEDPFLGDSTRWKNITDSKGKGKNPDFLGLNRNKKSLTLNLKTREGMTIF
jgi:crotonobetainyl-CoA:carnitine CoA-transferase CaiB-like acyl-CoA transferase